MERLTFDGNFCDIAQCKELPCPYNGSFTQRQVWERLKAYEDTGLTPEEAKRMSNILMDVGIDYNCSWEYVKNWLLDARLREIAEADKESRLFLLPLEPGRSMLCQEYFERPWVMKNVTLCVQYQSSTGIIFYMGYDVFRGLVEHGKITPLSPEGEKALEAKRND